MYKKRIEEKYPVMINNIKNRFEEKLNGNGVKILLMKNKPK